MHPLVDPAFRMRDDEGELTREFLNVWHANVASITELSVFTLAAISALQQEGAAPWNPLSAEARNANRFPTQSALAPAQPSTLPRKPRSKLGLTLAYIMAAGGGSPRTSADPTLSPAGPSGQPESGPGSLSGSPSASPGLGPFRASGSAPSATPVATAAATSPGPGTPGGPGAVSQSPILAALQEFAASCRLHERYWPRLDGPILEDERFPLLKGPVSRRATKLSNLGNQDPAGGNAGGPLQFPASG